MPVVVKFKILKFLAREEIQLVVLTFLIKH